MEKDICCYILYSEKLKKFYTGVCNSSLSERIDKHNSQFYGSKTFTSQSDDWELYLRIDTKTFSQAVRLETKIKSMKSSVYIRNLKNYPELVLKIKKETE